MSAPLIGMNIQFSDSDNLLDIRYDNVFKAVFTKNTPASQGALSNLISALIERKVTVASLTTNEPPIDDLRDRCIRFDIACKTENGELINIEMSLNPDSCELPRIEYYAGKLFTRQEIKGGGKNYANLKEAYQITILANGRFLRDEALIHTFEYYDPLHKVSLNGKSRIITVELIKAEQIIKKPVGEIAAREAWAAFFRYLTDREKREKINEILLREEGIAMAGEVLINISQDEIEWARQLSREKYINDYESDMSIAWDRGMEKGLEKGHKEKALEIAKNLKACGVPIKTISQSTGLSPEEISSLGSE